MKEEMLKILKMVEEGKLSSEKAAEMLSLLKERSEEQGINKKGRVLRISVESEDSDVVKVNVPIGFLKNMIKAVGPGYIQRMINQYAKVGEVQNQSGENMANSIFATPEGVDINLIMYAIENDLEGEIVNIQSDDSKVYIAIE